MQKYMQDLIDEMHRISELPPEPEIGSCIQVTSKNVGFLERALDELRESSFRLGEQTRHCPVECMFAGYRFVFSNHQDIQSLIRTLMVKILVYNASHRIPQRTE